MRITDEAQERRLYPLRGKEMVHPQTSSLLTALREYAETAGQYFRAIRSVDRRV